MISKVFKAYDVRQTYPTPLNEDVGWTIGVGVGQHLKNLNNGPGTVVCSRDHRPAAPSMQQALMQGIRSTGMHVVDLGRCDTSIQYFAIPFLKAAGGVQTTASHNPIEYIGYKVSGPVARPIGRDTGLNDIQKIAEQLSGECPQPTAGYEQRDLWDDYQKHITGFLNPPLNRPLKLYVDCSNGCGIELVNRVFKHIPNLHVIAINDRWTDQWAHEPNPLIPANMQPTVDGVKKHGADLGACFDGDADRCMLVDDKGNACGCDHLTAWLAEHFLKQAPGSSVVYDLRSSKVVEETIVKLGGKPAISKVGHVNIKAQLRQTDGIFGGELSGHFYFKHNAYADSGAITLAAALAVLGQSKASLSTLIAPFRKYPQSGEINFENDHKDETLADLKATYGKHGKVMELDGVTIDCWDTKGFWFNVRASNTEPLLRLNTEAKDQATLDTLLSALRPKLGHEHHGH